MLDLKVPGTPPGPFEAGQQVNVSKIDELSFEQVDQLSKEPYSYYLNLMQLHTYLIW